MSLDNQKEYWNKVAHTKTFTHPLHTELILKYAARTASVLDYGCGYGRAVSMLADAGFTNVTGYDTSIELVNRGRKEYNVSLHHISTPSELDVADGSVDCILLFAVLTCIPSNKGQKELINILYTKLKPGGILYISDYYLQPDLSEVGRYHYLDGDKDNYGVFTLPEDATFRHHTKEWIAELLGQLKISEEINVPVKTMNGHTAEAFQIIAQKM